MTKAELNQMISVLSEDSPIEVIFETSWGHRYDAKITGVTLTVNDGTLGAKIKADEIVEEKAKEPVAETQDTATEEAAA